MVLSNYNLKSLFYIFVILPSNYYFKNYLLYYQKVILYKNLINKT